MFSAVGIYESVYIIYKIIYETCNYMEPIRCPVNKEHPKEKNATHSPHLRNISLFGQKVSPNIRHLSHWAGLPKGLFFSIHLETKGRVKILRKIKSMLVL